MKRRVQIGGLTWTYKVCDTLPDGSEDWGLCDDKTQTIWIRRGPKETMQDTVLHETMHAIISTFGLQKHFKGQGEEDVVKVMSPVLCGLLNWRMKR